MKKITIITSIILSTLLISSQPYAGIDWNGVQGALTNALSDIHQTSLIAE